MNILAKTLRACAKLKFKALGHATIKDIPTKQFNQIIKALLAIGWKKTYEYRGFDAWIDYGKVILTNSHCKLIFEWDNWTEGSMEGPIKIVEKLATENKLRATKEWRWAEYDKT